MIENGFIPFNNAALFIKKNSIIQYKDYPNVSELG